jgi:hypothetical protein
MLIDFSENNKNGYPFMKNLVILNSLNLNSIQEYLMNNLE